MSDGVDLSEFRAAYVVEVQDLVGAATASLLAVETALRKGETNGRAVRELFRAMHTIKGLSAMVGVDAVVALAHRMEAALRTADRGGGRLGQGAVDTLLAGVRAVEQRVRAVGEGKPVADAPQPLLDELDRLETPEAGAPAERGGELAVEPAIASKLQPEDVKLLLQGAAEGRRALRADFAPSRARAEAGLNITSVRARVAALADVVKVVPFSVAASESSQGGLVFALLLLTQASDAQLAAAMGIDAADIRPLVAPRQPAPSPVSSLESEADDIEVQRHGVVRVEVSRLDEAMERLAAMVVTRFRLQRAVAQLAAHGADVRELREILTDNARQLRDLRGAILRVRMVPVTELFERMPLLVRGLQRVTGKQVRLQIDAGRAELDKAVAERIFPALVHLVRNAVDHAIEPPAERRRAGKPEEGNLTIACFERSNTQLEITISDDGSGVDRERVADRAGRPLPDSDAGLLELMCLPGLSTRDEASTTSGRGMGMDIVRRVIVDELGGELTMQTRAGVGTRFVLHVPLTISIVDAFSFECADRRFVVPVSMVEEILEVDPAQLVRAPARPGRRAHAGRMLERRGEAVPYIELETLFGLATPGERARKALVVRRNNEPIAFAVDRMLGQQEVVVRPLEDPLVKVPGVSGATDLGDGTPTLVLDLAALGATLATTVTA